jgi:hypothetical protein
VNMCGSVLGMGLPMVVRNRCRYSGRGCVSDSGWDACIDCG